MSKSFFAISLAAFTLAFTGCSQNQKSNNINQLLENPEKIAQLYSYIGSEYEVSFNAIARNKDYSLSDLTNSSVKNSITSQVKADVKYLFGPLTNREIGGMKLNYIITVDWANVKANGDVLEIPYNYSGTWIIENNSIQKSKFSELPLPYNSEELFTQDWKECTDSAPDHQTQSFFWYFWDPTRYGCDHKLDQEYQMVHVTLGKQTENQKLSYPEYQNIIQSNGEQNNLQMTFGFGYVEDESDANPDNDSDYGMTQYRSFVSFMDQQAKSLKLTKTAITQQEYLNPDYPNKLIGYRYSGMKDGVKIEVKVVAAANIDQMELFAKSYAHDHDGFFGWFGHSRVGSGFDADNFSSMVMYNPNFYNLSQNYQLVYWAGCNSYSYYTLPFFAQKSKINKLADPTGTKGLDIIANALPSLFSFNAANAKIAYTALINWNKPTSYQTIVSNIEKHAQQNGATVIVNVLGDEDNSK